MAQGILSILGLYNYDPSVFDNFVVPVAVSKDTVIENLLMELGEFELVYPSFDMMKFAIGAWSRKELDVWVKLYETTQYEYDAVANYDRNTTITEKSTKDMNINERKINSGSSNGSSTSNSTSSNNETRDLRTTNDQDKDKTVLEDNKEVKKGVTEHDSNTSGTSSTIDDTTSVKNVSAWNQENSYSPNERVVGDSKVDNKSTGKVEYSTEVNDTNNVDKKLTDKETLNVIGTDKGTVSNSGTGRVTDESNISSSNSESNTGNNSDVFDRTYTEITKGNVGTVATQELIRLQREVVKFNLINYIIDSFKARFCILIY